MGEVRAIANDSNGQAVLRSVHLTQDGLRKDVILEFRTNEAKLAVQEIEAHYEQLSAPEIEKLDNVLMVLFQSNKKIPDADQRTGDQAIIENIDPKPRPIVYVSDLARQRIKDQIIHGDENIYKKGFYVDVIVDRFRGRVACYKIVNVGQIIDLPDDL